MIAPISLNIEDIPIIFMKVRFVAPKVSGALRIIARRITDEYEIKNKEISLKGTPAKSLSLWISLLESAL